MSEWMSFGKMIDILKPGEVAENEYKNKYTLSDMGGFGPIKEPEDNIFLNGMQLKSKWRILPKYVSFDEAMKAHEKGKVVYFCGLNGEYKDKYKLSPGENIYRIGATSLEVHSLLSLYKGKWRIED